MSSRKSVLLFPNRSRFSDAPASSDVGSVASSTGAPDKRGAAGSGSGASSTGGPERGGAAGSGSERTGGAGGSVGREGGSGSAAIIGSGTPPETSGTFPKRSWLRENWRGGRLS